MTAVGLVLVVGGLVLVWGGVTDKAIIPELRAALGGTAGTERVGRGGSDASASAGATPPAGGTTAPTRFWQYPANNSGGLN